ncbi:MAG: hypothetical protein PGN11_02490, partial [Quadrisphaera sp.]
SRSVLSGLRSQLAFEVPLGQLPFSQQVTGRAGPLLGRGRLDHRHLHRCRIVTLGDHFCQVLFM